MTLRRKEIAEPGQDGATSRSLRSSNFDTVLEASLCLDRKLVFWHSRLPSLNLLPQECFGLVVPLLLIDGQREEVQRI